MILRYQVFVILDVPGNVLSDQRHDDLEINAEHCAVTRGCRLLAMENLTTASTSKSDNAFLGDRYSR